MDFIKKVINYCIYLYVIFVVIIPVKYESESNYVSLLLLAVIVLFYLIKSFSSHSGIKTFISEIRDFVTNFLSLSMTFLFLVMAVSWSYSLDKSLSLNESVRFLSYIVLFYMIKYNFKERKDIRTLMLLSIISALFINLICLYQYITKTGLMKVYGVWRVTSTIGNPNSVGAFIIILFFPIFLISLKEKKLKSKIALLILDLLMLFGLFSSGSRNALLGLIIGIFILALIYNYKIMYCSVILIVMFIFSSTFRQRVIDIANISQDESRLVLWKTALYMIKDHFWLGVGNGNFVTYYDTYRKKHLELQYSNYTHFPSHNSYLKIESELGVLGGISFISMLVSALFYVIQTVKNCQDELIKSFYTGFIASMAVFYFMNISDNFFFVPKVALFFWILLASSQACLYNIKE